MKKKYIIFILIIAVLGTWGSCKSDFLTVAPTSSADQNLLQSQQGMEALLVGAYSMIDDMSSQFGWESAGSNWVYGSIRGLEANKGTDSGDQQDINPLMTYTEDASNPYLNVKWREVYESISRCNNALQTLEKAVASGKVTADNAALFTMQFRTLRGWFHFEAWRMWGKVPYIDEKTDPKTVTNADDISDKIIADLSEGINLPLDMKAIGKFNKTVAEAMVAKAKMQMKHDYAGAKTLLLDIIATGKKPDNTAIGLAPTYGEIFDIANRNGIEAVYTVQYSVNDNSGGNNAGNGEVLNFPYKGNGGSPGGCCGFFNPTQDFVNSFSVTPAGLPFLDAINSDETVVPTYDLPANQNLRDFGIAGGGLWDAEKDYDINQGCTVYGVGAPFKDLGYVSNIKHNKGNNPLTSSTWDLKWTEDNSKPVDPRLDWSVGRRGIPYWDWGVHTGADWIRSQAYSGPYSPKKQVYKKSQEGKYTEVGNWTSGWTANGYRLIRFADILLMLAECQIETNDLAGAFTNINLVRNRASNTAGFVMESDGITPAANYQIGLYTVPFATADDARAALRMERKLELGEEGHRYFDLQRWGTVTHDLNKILKYEESMPWGVNLYGGAHVGPEDVNFPIPQRQLDLSNGKLTQNR